MSILISAILGLLAIGVLAGAAWGAKDDLVPDDEPSPAEEEADFLALPDDLKPDSYHINHGIWDDGNDH